MREAVSRCPARLQRFAQRAIGLLWPQILRMGDINRDELLNFSPRERVCGRDIMVLMASSHRHLHSTYSVRRRQRLRRHSV